MSDLADKANVTIEFQHGVNLHKSRRDEPVAVANGECWFCEELLPQGHRWCDAECRDNWEKSQN